MARFKLKPSKCELFQSQISYLGHIVSKEGTEKDPKKISAIHGLATTMNSDCSFLGFTNYYGKFIHKHAQIAKPFNTLISGEDAKSKKKLVEWNDDCEMAFQKLKTL